MELGKMVELLFHAPAQETWARTDLKVSFSNEEKTVTVKGFYDGGNVYRARFLPENKGHWEWRTEGIVEETGSFECVDTGLKGRVRAAGTHFEYANGDIYRPFGTTVYALAHQEDALVGETLESLKHSPFNKVRMCVFPKHYDYNHNEPPVDPFEKDDKGRWDVDRPCVLFWQRFEHILKKISDMGMQIDLILFHPYDRWGFSRMTMEENRRYLDYLLARLSAWPNIWWSLANEYDLFPHLKMEDWFEIEEYVAAGDPFHHLLSNHNCTALYPFERENVTHCCIQSSWTEHAGEWLREYRKPVIYDEMRYEGNIPHRWGNLSAFEMVHRFWTVCVSGAYATHGETFVNDEGVLWWSRGGQLRGESPARIAFLKGIMDELPGPVEPWEENPFGGVEKMTEEELEKQKEESPVGYCFARGIRAMEPLHRSAWISGETIIRGRCGKDVFLRYMGRDCASSVEMALPEDEKYRVEVIDIWNMTRTEAMRDASGRIRVELPGKEGMAVLAVKA